MLALPIDEDILVRTLHPDDAEDLFQLLERNRSRLRPWIHPSALPKTAMAARQFTMECFLNSTENSMAAMADYPDYDRKLDHFLPPLNPALEMGIWVNGVLAGEIVLGRLQDSFTTAEIGYWIDGESEGRGIITRCVCALTDYAIENMGIEQFVIGCAVDNLRSRAVPERLGYRLLGIVPDGEIVGDFVHDRAVFGIQVGEWLERKERLSQRV